MRFSSSPPDFNDVLVVVDVVDRETTKSIYGVDSGRTFIPFLAPEHTKEAKLSEDTKKKLSEDIKMTLSVPHSLRVSPFLYVAII